MGRDAARAKRSRRVIAGAESTRRRTWPAVFRKRLAGAPVRVSVAPVPWSRTLVTASSWLCRRSAWSPAAERAVRSRRSMSRGTRASLSSCTPIRRGRPGLAPSAELGHWGSTTGPRKRSARPDSSLGRPPCRRAAWRRGISHRSGSISGPGSVPGRVCSHIEDALHCPKRSAVSSNHRPGVNPGLVPVDAARAGSSEGLQGRRQPFRHRHVTRCLYAILEYSPATTRRKPSTTSSATAGVHSGRHRAQGHQRLMRCDRKFLSMIRV